jgi:hypothetical protein
VKKDLTMQPIRTNESNFTYLGPTRETADLPCRLEGQRDTFSVWEPTEEDRKIIAAGGHVRLGIHGVRPIPPVSLQVVANVGPYERKPDRCDVCQREVDDAVHASGPGTHAFRSRKDGYARDLHQ